LGIEALGIEALGIELRAALFLKRSAAHAPPKGAKIGA
jgi:hypothetical protein